MSKSRLLARLEAATDKKTLALYAVSNKNLEKEELLFRIFDGFPLLNESETANLVADFKKIAVRVTCITISNDKRIPGTPDNRDAIQAFIQKIAKQSCSELFDESANIHPEIKQLLKWTNSVAREKNGIIVCAYISSILSIISQNFDAELGQHPYMPEIIAYITSQYRKVWTADALQELDLRDMAVYLRNMQASPMEKIMNLPKNYPEAVGPVKIGLFGAAAIGLAIVAGVVAAAVKDADFTPKAPGQ